MPNSGTGKSLLYDELIKLSRIAGVVISLVGAIWWFGKAPFENAVTEVVDNYVVSNHFEVIHNQLFLDRVASDSFERALDTYISDNNSNTLSFRKVLAIKMSVPEENVASEMADLYLEDKARLKNILRLLNKEYPESDLWNTD